jgi:hypothetical protein
MSNIVLIITITLITFPLTHILMKKGMILDYSLTLEREKDLSKFFYIPYLNIFIAFMYLVWCVIKFKRP